MKRSRCKLPLRLILSIGTISIFLYFYLTRRRSTQQFLTESHISQFTKDHLLNSSQHTRRIPRIIHQTWKTTHVPDHWNATVESVRQLNANQFEYRLWTDEDMHRFVREKDSYFYQTTFLTYPLDIQRVDAFRYIVLYHLGGLYIDMDNGCSQSFESLFNALEILDPRSKHLAAFPRTSPVGISNGFMITTPGHPLFDVLRSYLSLFNHRFLVDYLTVMLSAGPLYVSFHEYYFDTSSKQSSVRILDEIVYSSIYTWHTPGNSWHGRDARIILGIYRRLRNFDHWDLFFLSWIGILIALCVHQRRCWLRRARRTSFIWENPTVSLKLSSEAGQTMHILLFGCRVWQRLPADFSRWSRSKLVRELWLISSGCRVATTRAFSLVSTPKYA